MNKLVITSVIVHVIVLTIILALGISGFVYLKKNMVMKSDEKKPIVSDTMMKTLGELVKTSLTVEKPQTDTDVPTKPDASTNNEKKEEFDVITSLDPQEAVQKDKITQCQNKSLNKLHEIGKDKIEVNELIRDTHDCEGNLITTKNIAENIPVYEQSTHILGSNYMVYNENPNPYYADYPLYDKNDKANIPVGVNFM